MIPLPKARVIPLRPGGTLNLPSPLLSLRTKRVQCGGIRTWCRDDHTPVTAAPEFGVMFGARLDTLLNQCFYGTLCTLRLRVAVDDGTLRYYDEARARCPRALASVAQRQRRCQSSSLDSAFACQRIAHQRLRRNPLCLAHIHRPGSSGTRVRLCGEASVSCCLLTSERRAVRGLV
jgi:hypothetical protein